MESKKSIFNSFSSIFKSEPWYLPFPQIIQDFAVRFASEDKSEKDLFKKTKKLLMRKYKEMKSNKDLAVKYIPDKNGKQKAVTDYLALSKHLDVAIYEDEKILPNLIKLGDEEFLSKLFLDIDKKENSTDLKIGIVSNDKCPVEILLMAVSSVQPAELRKVALLRPELSYAQKMTACEDFLVGNSDLRMKYYFSQNLQPNVSDVPALMDRLAENAMNKNTLTSLWMQYDRFIIKISGYVCEPDSYATADLILENTVLFREDSQNKEVVQLGTFKNRDAAASFLKKKFGSLPFVVNDFVVPESELPVEEEVLVETKDVSVETIDDNTKDSKKSKCSKKK